MTYLTLTQIKEAAKTSDKAALECSRLHHHQAATCNQASLRIAWDNDEFDYSMEFCAACERWYNKKRRCLGCPLDDDEPDFNCCDGLYAAVDAAHDEWRDNPTPKTFRAFQTAARAVERYIAAKIEEIA